MNRIITGILILSILLLGYGKDSSYVKNKIPDRQSDYPVGVSFIPEMDFIPEIDSWSYCDTTKDKYSDDILKAKADWKEKQGWIKDRINVKIVISLSRWAKKEMKKYRKIPALPTDIKLKPIRYSEIGNKVVFESTLDTLPTHSSIVTRWLKIIILYDRITESITKVTFTIRGEILE